MVQVYYMKHEVDDQRLPLQCTPPKPVDLEELKKKTGVLYFSLDPTNYTTDLQKMRTDRGYTYEDVIEISPKTLPDYKEKIKIFFQEHLHADEEIRFITAGSGFFDVRDDKDEWIRVAMTAGDLIILPAGIYHRFTLDTKDYIKAMRLFVGEPVWTPHNRPADDMDVRKNYVKQHS